MSTFAIFCVLVGLLMILTRAPLVIAPVATRDVIFNMISSEGRIRAFGVFASLLGVIGLWVSGGVADAVAHIVWYVAWVMIAAGALFMVPFPAPALRVADRVWHSFSPLAMRLLGVLAVALGGALVYYGMTL